MSRLIDADAFKDYIRGACEDMKHLYKDNGAWAKEITESFCKDIDEQPTIHTEPHWIYKCTRKNFCVDCDDPDCLLAGEVEADCPKWICDNPTMDCENCEFLKKYKREVTE